MAPYFRPSDRDPENGECDERGEGRGRTIVFVQRHVKPNRYSDINYRTHPQEHLLDAPILSPASGLTFFIVIPNPEIAALVLLDKYRTIKASCKLEAEARVLTFTPFLTYRFCWRYPQ